MARAASSIGTLPRSVPMPGIAITLKLLRSAAISAARAARRTFSAPITMPGSSIVGTWMTFFAGSWPAVVTIAAPTAIGAAAIAACCDVAGTPHVRTAAELDRFAADRHDAHLVAVLLTEHR